MSERVRLGEIIDVASGQVDPRTAPYCNLLHVGGDNIESDSGQIFGLRTARELNLISGKYEFGPSDVLYSKIRPALNKVALPDFKGICSADMYPLRPRKGRVERRYLAHLLRHNDFLSYAEKHSTRTNIPKINREALLSYELMLPSIHEQFRIADLLDKADAIRRKRKEALALTEELLRSVFLEMFGDPVANPMGWPRSTFGSQLELLEYGPRFYNEKYSDDGIRIVRITDLNASGRLDFSAMPRLIVDERDRLRYALRPGDVIFARSGATVGKTALSMPGDPESIPGAYFIRLRFKPEVRPLFARQVLASERIQKIIVSRSRQSAQQNFSGPGIRELPLPVPPHALQERLEQLATARQAIFEHYRRADTESQVLFNSLLDQAFTARSGRAGVVG